MVQLSRRNIILKKNYQPDAPVVVRYRLFTCGDHFSLVKRLDVFDGELNGIHC